MSISKISYVLIGIILCNSACLKRVVVEPGSERIPNSDFVEVTLNSGEEIVLRNVVLGAGFMQGEHRGKIVQIHYDDINKVEVINRDYRKVFTYYLIGGAIALTVVSYLIHHLPEIGSQQ